MGPGSSVPPVVPLDDASMELLLQSKGHLANQPAVEDDQGPKRGLLQGVYSAAHLASVPMHTNSASVLFYFERVCQGRSGS